MPTQNFPKKTPVLSAAQLAGRLGKHESTISFMACGSSVVPVMRIDVHMVFAQADVLKIEANYCAEDSNHDFTIYPMTSDGRTSPTVLLHRVDTAKQALDAALVCQHRGGEDVPKDTCENLRRVLVALRCQVGGGDGAHDLPSPSFGPREVRGIYISDPASPAELCDMSYCALVHLLCSKESRDALSDLGPRSKQDFFHSIETLEALVGKISTQ